VCSSDLVKRKFGKVALIGSNPTVAGAAERCKLWIASKGNVGGLNPLEKVLRNMWVAPVWEVTWAISQTSVTSRNTPGCLNVFSLHHWQVNVCSAGVLAIKTDHGHT